MTDHTPEHWPEIDSWLPWIKFENCDPRVDWERLRACVNACDGIPTEQLGNVTALVLAARRVWSEIEETEYGCPTDVSDEAAGKLASALAPFRKD